MAPPGSGFAHVPVAHAAGAKLVLSKEERLRLQTKQIGKIIRDAIGAKRSLNGKKMKNIKSVFQAIDKDGSGVRTLCNCFGHICAGAVLTSLGIWKNTTVCFFAVLTLT
jgi:hypothetical protein|eukprot:COSAG02_NODE_1221_length_13805_cov_24.976653_4_plen_109_part_00